MLAVGVLRQRADCVVYVEWVGWWCGEGGSGAADVAGSIAGISFVPAQTAALHKQRAVAMP